MVNDYCILRNYCDCDCEKLEVLKFGSYLQYGGYLISKLKISALRLMEPDLLSPKRRNKYPLLS